MHVSRFYEVDCLNKKKVTIPDPVLKTTTIFTIIENCGSLELTTKIEQAKWEEE